MFINLSNHPFITWSPSQLSAAREYGDLEEIAFPNIDPGLSKFAVEKMATSYVTKILEHYPTENLTVHIMGEQTFSYHVVKQLQKAGVRCIASTTERIVEETEDHRKLVQFSFVQFREY
ncbi:CRISPR-associated protein [Prevotella jejuni]|jgi:CRISPR-associated dxthg domain-containing protein|uniref:CRISPR-associated protein n=1 Tax=Prevotella jejuni TaxID=1177574 RepID=UPI002011D0F0|nr:CRISPR-associated protein [Prevotella jejuni]